MTIFPNNIITQVSATDVEFIKNDLHVSLSDGRIITLPFDDIPWLQWLATAPSEKQLNWSLEPGGFAIYWEDLDDGIEIVHLLAAQPLN